MAFKKNKISDKLSDYSICLLGESGIGKTTTMVEVGEKEFGEDGYVIFNMGKEQGIDCIDNATYDDIPDWKTFDAKVKDIVKNKNTEYKDLKVVIIDTLDQCIEIAEPEVIRRWNVENTGKKDFSQVKTINQSWGGFGRGEDKVIEIILEKVWELQKAGVRVWYTGHVKTREIIDPITNMTYTTLSTNMMTKYFNGFKTKMHVVGIAAIDRTIEIESTGRKNIVTKKDITVNKIKEERRKIVFRDDSYSVDSKSRLSGIVNEITMDSDELIKALKDAIKNSKKTTNPKASKPVVEEVETETELPFTDVPVKKDVDLPFLEDEVEEDLFKEDEEVENKVVDDYPDNLLDVIREMWATAKSDPEKSTQVKAIIKPFGKLVNADEEALKKVYDIIK